MGFSEVNLSVERKILIQRMRKGKRRNLLQGVSGLGMSAISEDTKEAM